MVILYIISFQHRRVPDHEADKVIIGWETIHCQKYHQSNVYYFKHMIRKPI